MVNCSARIRASWASAGTLATLTASKPPANAATKGAMPLRRIVRSIVHSLPLLRRSDMGMTIPPYSRGGRASMHNPRKPTTQNWRVVGRSESDGLPSARLRTPLMEDERTLADLLRRHRLAAGLTQMALAERAGLSLRGLSDIERGLRTAPHRDTLERLAEALHLDEVDTAALHQAGRRRGKA